MKLHDFAHPWAEIPHPAEVRRVRTAQRRRIISRDGMRCQYCACAVVTDIPGQPRAANALTIDHRLPRCRGGLSVDENLCVACWSCNSAKGELSAEEFAEMRTRSIIARFEAAYTDSVLAEEACREIIRDIRESHRA